MKIFRIILFSLCSSTSYATTVYFEASGFVPQISTIPSPADQINGSFSYHLDSTNVVLDELDMNILGTQYSETTALIEHVGSTNVHIQDNNNGAIFFGNTNDYFIVFAFDSNGPVEIEQFFYATEGVLDAWGTLDITISDVAPVPLPAAIWFMGSGLLGLMCFYRKNKAQVAAV